MKEALLKARLTHEDADLVCDACAITAQRAAEEGELSKGFTTEDAAAISMYTYEFGKENYEKIPYKFVNMSLVGRNYAELKRASGLLYLLLSALRKMPRYTGRTLYRGIQSKVDVKQYKEGNVIPWRGFSSTSPDMKLTKTLLKKGTEDGKATGTLFIIENGWGYNIQPYSLFPGEEEILLEPERQFKVTNVISSSDLTVINLEMLDTPLLLPEVFGHGRE